MRKYISFIITLALFFLSSISSAMDLPVTIRAPQAIVAVSTQTYTVGAGDNVNKGRYYESFGSLLITSYAGDTTISLPDYAATQSGATVPLGASVCVYSSVAQKVIIDPSADDKIRLNATLGSAGATISSASAIGDFICLILQEASSDVGIWASWGRSGTWTAP